MFKNRLKNRILNEILDSNKNLFNFIFFAWIYCKTEIFVLTLPFKEDLFLTNEIYDYCKIYNYSLLKSSYMRKLLLLAAVSFFGIGAYAQDNVVVTTSGGKQQVYNTDAVKSITFEGTTMKVNKTDKSVSDNFNLVDVEKITFNLANGINNLPVGEKLTVTSPAGSNVLYINGYDAAKKNKLGIYDVSGKAVKNLSKWAGEPIDLSSLPKGVYILKVNNNTIKFRK